MKQAVLEHVNLTVSNPDASAELFCRLFDWRVRWSGEAINNGRSVHVGGDDSYVVFYSPGKPAPAPGNHHDTVNGLNHIAVVVEDLDQIEQRVIAEGLKTHNHADYEPGRRFYFDMPEGVEVEVVSYV